MPLEAVFRPPPPYMITPHLQAFTLPGRPTPWIYAPGPPPQARILLGPQGVPVDLVFRGEPWRPRILVRAHGPGSPEALEAAGRILRVDYDWNGFLDAARRAHPALARLAEKYPGLRPGRCLSLAHALMDAVVKQRIPLRLALRLYSRLVESYAPKKTVEGRTYYGHPSPEAIVEAGVEEVRGHGLTRLKAEALVEIAEASLEGRLPGAGEVERDPWRVARELTRIRGVGPWTAELAVAMVHPRFPIGPRSDLAVRRGLSRILGVDPGSPEARRILEALGDHAGLAMYLAALEYEKLKKKAKG